MKTTTTLILIFTIISSFCSQSNFYKPFPINYGSWVYHYGVWTGSSYNQSWTNIDWAGDTTINSISYKKILNNGNYIGGVRQDTLNQKTFYIDMQSIEHDVSFNHNISIGDTIIFTSNANKFYHLYRGGYPLPPDTVIITQIDSISYHKKITLLNINSQGSPNYIEAEYIEGVGISSAYGFEYAYSLNCFRNESNLLIGSTSNPLCALSIENKQFINSKAYPNPTNNILNIGLNNPNNFPYDLSIYDNLGRKVHGSNFIIDEEIEIDVRDFKNGIYHYTLFCPTQNVRSNGKFIKN